MTISINWPTGVIFIPRDQLTFISGTTYLLDVNELRLALKDMEDSEEGSIWPDTHRHNTAVTLSGVTYARQVEILAPYTITFQDVGTPYTVSCVGANHNIADRKNVNNVSLIIGNSAGLIMVSSDGGATGNYPTVQQISEGVWNTPLQDYENANTVAAAVWDRNIMASSKPNSFGEYITKKILSLARFNALKR